MKIPSPKRLGLTHDSWSREGSKNKNSQLFLDNYDDIFRDRKPIRGHLKIVWKNGKRYELPNPATHGKAAQMALDKFNQETGGIKVRKETI
jgi:hypothetical protein